MRQVIALVLPAVRARCSRTITIVLPPQAERASALVATALSAYSAAVCGALCQLFVKVVAVTLHEAGGDFAGPHSPWRHFPPYLALLGLLFTAPLQLYLLDTALTGSSVSYAVPVYQALLILLTTAAGGVFFGEFETMTRPQLLSFCAGVATAALGLAVLSASGGQAADEVAPVEPESPVKLARRMRHSYHHPPREGGQPVERSASFDRATRRTLRSPVCPHDNTPGELPYPAPAPSHPATTPPTPPPLAVACESGGEQCGARLGGAADQERGMLLPCCRPALPPTLNLSLLFSSLLSTHFEPASSPDALAHSSSPPPEPTTR